MVVEVFCSPLPAAAAAAAADADAADGIIAAADANNCSSTRQLLGTECHVTCPRGFELSQPVDSYTCRYDGRALWHPASPPVCYGRLCSFTYYSNKIKLTTSASILRGRPVGNAHSSFVVNA